MKRKYPAIDLLKLIREWDTKSWNIFLEKCFLDLDIERLKGTLYGLQVGMDIAARHHLNTEDVAKLFIRFSRSIEITMKKILVKKYPSPADKAEDLLSLSEPDIKKSILSKKLRDEEFRKFMQDSRF